MKIIFILIIGLTTLLGCGSSENFIVDEIRVGDTLTFITRYSDCGEWGGHVERIQVFDSLGLRLKYVKDEVDCDQLPYPPHKVIITKTRKLSQADKKSIQNYITDIKKRVVAEEMKFPCSNASDMYRIIFKGDTTEFIDWCQQGDRFEKLAKAVL